MFSRDFLANGSSYAVKYCLHRLLIDFPSLEYFLSFPDYPFDSANTYAGVSRDPSVVRQLEVLLFKAARARVTLARMSLALAVQMNGLGLALCTAMYGWRQAVLAAQRTYR